MFFLASDLNVAKTSMMVMLLAVSQYGAGISKRTIQQPYLEAYWLSYFYCKVREGRTNGKVSNAENFGGIAEVMLIVQVSF